MHTEEDSLSGFPNPSKNMGDPPQAASVGGGQVLPLEGPLQAAYTALLLEYHPNPLCLFDEHMRFLSCSAAATAYLSQSNPKTLVGAPYPDIFSSRIDSAWVKKTFTRCREVLKTRQSLQYEDAIPFDGQPRLHAQTTIVPLLDSENNLRGVLLFSADNANADSVQQQIKLATTFKNNYLAGMSHDIRTSMNAVKGLSELLSLTQLDDVQRNYVTSIISSTGTLLGIINDVLDFSQLDTNHIDLVKASYSVGDLMAEVSNAIALRAAEKHLDLLVEASPNLPSKFYGDETRIKQIIIALLLNALKHTPAGFIRFSIYDEVLGGQTFLFCAVEDSGAGFSEQEIAALFGESLPFGQQGRDDEPEPTLAISRQLARAMGGQINVQSAPGTGSIFTFRVPQGRSDDRPLAMVETPGKKRVALFGTERRMSSLMADLTDLGVSGHIFLQPGPANPAALQDFTHVIYDAETDPSLLPAIHQALPHAVFGCLRDVQKAMEPVPAGETLLFAPLLITDLAQFLGSATPGETADRDGGTPADFVLQGAELLVVDDNELNLMVAGEMLASFGAGVTSAGGGKQALELASKQHFDIIFLDHFMPGIDGIEVASQLHIHPGPNQATPLVALTANVVSNMHDYYIRYGMDDFISKPIDFQQLSRVLYKWLPKQKIFLGGKSTHPDTLAETAGSADTLAKLVSMLDEYGLQATDVVWEMDKDYLGYFKAMGRAAKSLGPLAGGLQTSAQEENWDQFSLLASDLYKNLFAVGARNDAANARRMSLAAAARSTALIYSDLQDLLDNVFFLSHKLALLSAYATRQLPKDQKMNDPAFLRTRLSQLQQALSAHNADTSLSLLSETAAYSLNRLLDEGLKRIKTDIESGAYDAAEQKLTALLATLPV